MNWLIGSWDWRDLKGVITGELRSREVHERVLETDGHRF